MPNLAAHSHIDTLTVPTLPMLGGFGKTAKCITFHEPLIDLHQTHHTLPPSSSRKNTKAVHVSDPERSTINGIKCKLPSSVHQLPLPALKTHTSHPPTTKPKSALKPKSTEVTTIPLSTVAVWDIITLK